MGIRIIAGLVLATGLGLVAGSAARPLEPLVVGWEQIFKLEWEAAERQGEPVVRGYLVNDSPYTLTRVQLLVDALNEAGGIVAQRVSWVGGDLAAFTRVFFETPAPRRAPRYQVRVFAFDRVEADGKELTK